MRKFYFILSILFLITLVKVEDNERSNPPLEPLHSLRPELYHGKISRTIVDILLKNHYRKIELNDSISTDFFNQYIDRLDPGRFYFLDSDIKEFNKYRLQFCTFLIMGKLDPMYEIFNKYLQRIEERFTYIFERIKKEFDFTLDESYNIDRDSTFWAISSIELDEIWRKRLKYEALNLKLAGKKWTEISELLEKRYHNFQTRVHQTQSEDVFQVMMNSFTEIFDPNTNYFSPKRSDDFKIEMSRALEGIGAELTTDYYYTIVHRIVAGGPADKSKLLHANDKIIGVGQGDEEIVDIIGWRLDDVVQLIRGPKSTTVRLIILKGSDPPGSPPDTIAIVRDKVKLEDSSVKSDTLDITYKDKKFRIGVIDIPAFYLDYSAMHKGERDYKSTTRDVRRLVNQLKQAEIDGIIIDLRGNGGGFLNEAIELTGLFIRNGPVVQVKDTRGYISSQPDPDPYIVYDGPLAVLVDYQSASASEIFTAAIQDYNRGIILGGQTYGKGTVQKAVDLNMIFKNFPQKLGQIKFTNAKFYRINGGSVQHVGVIPDIPIPLYYEAKEIGESSHPNALLWDKIRPIHFDDYNMVSSGELNQLVMLHESRIARDTLFTQYLDDVREFKKNKSNTIISLNEEKRKKDQKEKKKETKRGNKKEDIILLESAHILCDLIVSG